MTSPESAIEPIAGSSTTDRSTDNETPHHFSRAGYRFSEDEPVWVLDKNTRLYVGKVLGLLGPEFHRGFVSTLSYYARSVSSSHARSICDRAYIMLRDTCCSQITTQSLINYRATLTRETEWYMSTLRGFFYKWRDLGHPGIGVDVIDLLDSWTLKGNIVGDAVKRLDPTEGPLTDNELLAFNEGAVHAFEKNTISLTELAISLTISHTGRRPRQIAQLKIGDLDGTQKNNKGEPLFLIHIPRAKQRGEVFRDSFKTFSMTQELWTILSAQRRHCIESVEQILELQLQDREIDALPVFPDLHAFQSISIRDQLLTLSNTDALHLRSAEITRVLKKVVSSTNCRSERTGDPLNVFATRFRYTTGTRAAREGFGPMIIAELLDHTNTQNASIYVKNIPEHVAALDKAVGFQLASFAQAFQGVLVDREEDALRGNDPASRIRHKGEGTGSCGTYGYCGANVPIPCYTCIHFQPWVEGPHETIYAELIAERERVLAITGDLTVAAANDRTILAIAQVILSCQKRRSELAESEAKN